MWFSSSDDGGIRYSKRFEALLPGEWSFMAGERGLHSYLGANTDSPGTWRDVHGRYLGENALEDIFIGPASARTDKSIRGGFFKVGDQFWLQGTGLTGSYSGWTVRKEGYRGNIWYPGQTYIQGNALGAIADMIEPATNDPDEPLEGSEVYRCVQTGESGPGPVVWTQGAPVVDGTVIWEYAGPVALYNRIGEVARDDRLTTTDAVTKTLARYVVENGVVTYLDIYVVAIEESATAAGTFRLSGSWYGSGGDAITVRTENVDQADSPGWTAVLVPPTPPGNVVELQVTGAAATTIKWTAVRRGLESK